MASTLNEDLLRAAAGTNYATVACVAFLYYDYLLTFPKEILLYWRDWRFTSTSFFFFANRYVSLFGHIPVMLEFFGPISVQSCRHYTLYHQCYSGVTSVLIAILLIIRTYALYERKRAILILLLGAALAAAAVSVWSIIPTHNLPRPVSDPEVLLVSNCDHSLSSAQGRFLVAPWASILVFDTVVFVLTLYRRLAVGRTLEHGLFSLMLRDGIIFYGVLLVLYITNVLTLLVAAPPLKGISVTFTNVISASMMNRLMLNIRDNQRVVVETNYNGMSTLHFSDDSSERHLTIQEEEVEQIELAPMRIRETRLEQV